MIDISFQCVALLTFVRLCNMCVLCRVYVGRILSSLCLLLWFGYVLYIQI
jgi:hypothetical protein